jgi:lipopolysaccharide transport system ATP-binding protein
MSYVIRFESVSKRYRIRHQQNAGYVALRDVIAEKAKSVARAIRRPGRGLGAATTVEDFWALQDVSFQIGQGDRLGIIGRNGAGKSTLLKILSRITEPTSGRIHIKGRVATLLEVGTGFHPELTGRENIYLNGAILGMKKVEIERKFDAIVDFSEVEAFLDTPVKRYSSGMYVRLAFAVAAHLDPEILVVDEVLAVGDAAFQKKCLGKMETVAKEGRTVLFVSHNLGAIQNLCTRCVLLNKGKLITEGEPAKVVATYIAEGAVPASAFSQPHNPDKPINLRSVSLSTSDGTMVHEFGYDQAIRISIEYEVNQPISNCSVWLELRTGEQAFAFVSADTDAKAFLFDERKPGFYRTTMEIPGSWLNAGMYFLVVGIAQYPQVHYHDRVECTSFIIHDTGTPEMVRTGQHRPGILQPLFSWGLEAVDSREPKEAAKK